MLWLIVYSELSEKFILKFQERYKVSYEEVVDFIRRSDLNILTNYVMELFKITSQKEAFHYAELIKDDIMNSKSFKDKDNTPKINVSYIGCGSTTARWQWGNDNGGPACTGSNRCWGTILNGNYVPNMEDTLYSPIINASGYNNLVLKFRHWYYTETNYDQGFVLCSGDGGATWNQIAGPIQGNSGGWLNATIFLPSQCQNTSQLRIAFRFKSDGSVQYYGWYIDDFSVETQTGVVLYASSFEGGDNGDLQVVAIGGPAPWQRGTPTSGPNSAYDGSNVWATNLSGNYNNSADEAIEKVNPISLSCPGCTNYYLRFYHWYQTESCCDSGWVEINTGASWVKASPGYKGSNTTWSSQAIDLTPYAGSNIRFRFRFQSDGSVIYAGWYIDSVSIVGTIPGSVIISYDFNSNDGGFTATQSVNITDPYMLSNNYLEWYIDILTSNDLGTYTARTGPAHPFGIISVLYGAQFSPVSAWSSWTTIRSVATLIDYITKNGSATAPAPYTSVQLKPYASTVICEPAVPRLTIIYDVNANGDNFRVKEIFWITGSDVNSSRLWHKTVVINNANTSRAYGVRWQYDTHVGSTDHPAHFQCDFYPSNNLVCGSQITAEQTINPVPTTFDFLRESDSDPPSAYHLFAVYADGGAQTGVTPPSFVQHIRWIDAHGYTWDQGVDGENISLSTGSDNAFNYFFNPVIVNPGDSIVYQHFIGSPITITPVNYDEVRIGKNIVKVYRTAQGFNIYYTGNVEIPIKIYNISGALITELKLRKGNNFVKVSRSGIYIIKGNNFELKAIR
ncbi:MAG: hypothetical protein ABIL49_02525 [candidate division WOR-3 bacterium]